jgi:hypothetical protein
MVAVVLVLFVVVACGGCCGIGGGGGCFGGVYYLIILIFFPGPAKICQQMQVSNNLSCPNAYHIIAIDTVTNNINRHNIHIN